MTCRALLDDPALQAVLRALPEARIVGGAVRDCLAGEAGGKIAGEAGGKIAGMGVHDIDLATPRLPADVITALRAAGLKAVPTGLAHGTVTAVVDHRGFEITTLRRDIATDGRHAIVAFTDDWQQDAARRDFTINAMSMSADGKIFDYFQGIEDLHAGCLRFVGDSAARIAEDYLRILRFFRFWARHATQPPDAATAAALQAGIPGIAQLSPERVWGELRRILATPDPGPAIILMYQLGVLAALLPEGAAPARLVALLGTDAPADAMLRLAALLTGDAAQLATRLRLANAEQAKLIALRSPPAPHPGDDDAALRRLLADTPPKILRGRTWLAGDATPAWAQLRHRLGTIPRPYFPLAGRDALALGLPPGPAIGALLRQVRAWWYLGGCIANADACRAELRRLGQHAPG